MQQIVWNKSVPMRLAKVFEFKCQPIGLPDVVCLLSKCSNLTSFFKVRNQYKFFNLFRHQCLRSFISINIVIHDFDFCMRFSSCYFCSRACLFI